MKRTVKQERHIEMAQGVLFNIATLGIYAGFAVSIQHTMTRSQAKKCCRVSFRQFKEAFNEVAWIYDPEWPHSLFGKERKREYFHASVIIINGVGCLFTSIGLLRANRLRDAKIRQLRPKECACSDDVLISKPLQS